MAFDVTSYLLAKKALDSEMEHVPHLNENGKIPADNLPSYVDDITEGYLYNNVFYEDAEHTIPVEPEGGKIYIDITTTFTYRWSGSTYGRVNETDLSDYYTRSQIDGKVNNLNNQIQAEQTRAVQKETNLEQRVSNIEEDYLTSTDKEQLSGQILDEVSRAEGAEGALQTAINSEATRAADAEDALGDAIGDEETRAKGVESSLDTKINTAAVNLTTAIEDETTRAENAEDALDDKIAAEETRAKGAETTISNALNQEITNRTQAVTAEATRATAAEKALDDRIDAISEDYLTSADKIALNTAITTERSRAVAAEQTLADTIDTKESALQKAIDDEETRAKGVENTLDGKIATETTRATAAESTLDTKIDDEITRAEGTEGSLNTKIEAETTRATGAEDTLDDKIDDETTRATAAESALDGKITAETTRATAAEASLDSKIDDETANRTADIVNVGLLIGYEKNASTGNFQLLANGLLKQTKDLADNNKSRLDNLATGLEVANGNVGVKNDMTVEGNLTVKGTTTTTDQETIQSQATLIITNSFNAPLVDYTGVVALKGTFKEFDVTAANYHKDFFYYKENNKYILDESSTYTEGRQYYVAEAEAASIYDKIEDALLLGEGIYYGGTFVFNSKYIVISLTEYSYVPNKYYLLVDDEYILATGPFDPAATYYARVSQGQHLATRVDSEYLTDKHLIEWDGNSFILIDSGKSVEDIENEITNKYNTLNSKINTETTRATTAEDALSGRIDGILDGETLESFADVEDALAGKQSNIADLATIRSGAAAGATAVQDNNYVHTDNNYTTTEKNKLDGIEAGAEANDVDSVNGKTGAVVLDSDDIDDTNKIHKFVSEAEKTAWNGKQNAINDLATIRRGAEAGATAVQDDSYVHTDNNYTTNEKTKLGGIEAGAQKNPSYTVETWTFTLKDGTTVTKKVYVQPAE